MVPVLMLLGALQAPVLDSRSEHDALRKCVDATSLDAATMECYRRASANAGLRMQNALGGLQDVLAPRDFQNLRAAQQRWQDFRESDRAARKAVMGASPGTLDLITDSGQDYGLVSERADALEGWVERLVR